MSTLCIDTFCLCFKLIFLPFLLFSFHVYSKTMSKVYKGVIFDLDGTLGDIDGERGKDQRLWDKVVEKFGHFPNFPRIKEPYVKASDMLRKWVDWFTCANQNDALEIAGEAELLYREVKAHLYEEIDLFEDALPALESAVSSFRDRVGLATTTNRQNFDTLDRRFGIGRFFNSNALVTQESVSVSKPAAEPYERAAQDLGLSPIECIAVEDTPEGILSAVRAGVGKIIWVQRKDWSSEHLPEEIESARTIDIVQSLDQVQWDGLQN